MKTIKRSEIKEQEYLDIFEKESHHNHEIEESEDGILRWKENKYVMMLIKHISLNDLLPLLSNLGYDKNSEVYRKLYRDMGYSLNGYWEVFYCEVNNEDTELYEFIPTPTEAEIDLATDNELENTYGVDNSDLETLFQNGIIWHQKWVNEKLNKKT